MMSALDTNISDHEPSNSCKSFLVTHLQMVKHLSVSKPDLAVIRTVAVMDMAKATAISSLGSVDQLAQLLPGSVVEVIDMTSSKVMTEVQLRRGLQVALAVVEIATVATDNRADMALLHPVLLAELHLGNNSKTFLHPLPAVSKTMATEDIQVVDTAPPVVLTLLLRVWAPPPVLAVVLAVLVLHQA